MKKITSILALVVIILLTGCSVGNKGAENSIEKNAGNQNMQNQEIQYEDEIDNQDLKETIENLTPGTLEEKEMVSLTSSISMDPNKMQIASDTGYVVPITEINSYEYISNENDVVKYIENSEELSFQESFVHQGFSGVEIIYEKTQYAWNDFFDELSVTEFSSTLSLTLQKNNIYEEEIIDDYEKYDRYYWEEEGFYYEVQDVMLGNFLDEEAELVHEQYGQVCNFSVFEEKNRPNRNPLFLMNGEEVIDYYITSIDDLPYLFFETMYNDKLYQKWVDMKTGILFREYAFDSDGLIVQKKELNTMQEKDISKTTFIAPEDIEYRDYTMFLYSFIDKGFDPLSEAVQNLLPNTETGILLTDDEGQTVKIYTTGEEEMILTDPVYVVSQQLSNGDERILRYISTDRFYTICDELKKADIYDISCNEMIFFNFDDVGLMTVEITENGMDYVFYDPIHISASGMYPVYHYVIEANQITNIMTYNVENVIHPDSKYNQKTYRISLIEFDTDVYDERFLEEYEIIDHGEGSYDDGEHIPFWYE